MSDGERLAEALGGTVGGHIRGPLWTWQCATCPAHGDEPTEHDAGLALYSHRKTHDPGGLNDDRPHSRACGIRRHPHGPECSHNCPTCGGRAP